MSLESAIHAIGSVKSELVRFDPAATRPELPSRPARRTSIDAAARRLSGGLPPSYREFLGLHDGWHHFFQGVSLLSAAELGRRSMPALTRASFVFVGEEPSLVPFALDDVGESLFAWDLGRRHASGECSTIAYLNGVMVRVESFPELLELVLDMLSADADERRKRIRRAAQLAATARPPQPVAGRTARARPSAARHTSRTPAHTVATEGAAARASVIRV